MTDFLDQGFEKALVLMNAVDEDFVRLSLEVETFLRVHAAQGVIDNGGYKYFFEADWPDNPPYSDFFNAYHRIGCIAQAKELERVVDTFPFESPHLHCDQRNEFMDAHWDEEIYCVETWGDKLCGDKEVWKILEEYYLRNQNKFV